MKLISQQDIIHRPHDIKETVASQVLGELRVQVSQFLGYNLHKMRGWHGETIGLLRFDFQDTTTI